MARITHIGAGRRTRLSLDTGPITDFRFEPGGFGHSASHSPRAEVAGPYRSQSSVPSIRREASPREHRTVPSRAPAASAPVVQSPRIPSVHAGARPSLGALASLIAPLAPSLLGLARPTVSALPDILAHALAPMAPTTVPPGLEQRTLGSPSLHELLGAGAAGRLGLNAAGKITTPRIRSAVGSLRQARNLLSQSVMPRFPGLDPEQAQVAGEVLRIGRRKGATPKELLASIETGLDESGLRNLHYGDASSEGWRQELTTNYGPRAHNVGASAQDFFNETATVGHGAGMTPGQLAQAVQRPANPDPMLYERFRSQAEPILQGFLHAKPPRVTRSAYAQAAGQARRLGLPAPTQQEVLRPQQASGGAPAPKPIPHADARYFVRADGNEHLRFVPLFANRLAALAKASGEPLRINSGFRTYAEQEASYKDYLNGGTLAAKPGSSNHEFGLAADIQLTPKQRALLPRFGLGLPVAGENWHVELTDPTLRAKAGYDSPGSVGAVPYGGSAGGAVLTGSGTSSTPGAGQASGEQPGAGLGLVSLTSPLAAGPVMPDIPGVSEGEDPSAELLALLTRGRRRLG